jgi:hypothetical protein
MMSNNAPTASAWFACSNARPGSNRRSAMWGSSIVGFGSYHYRYASGREGDTPLIGFSPRKGALAIYFTESFDAFEDCLATLGPHSAGKGCLRIKRLSDVDESVLSHMIERSVERQRQREPAPTG